LGANALYIEERTCDIFKSINTLRAGLRDIRTCISAKNQQLSVALPTP